MSKFLFLANRQYSYLNKPLNQRPNLIESPDMINFVETTINLSTTPGVFNIPQFVNYTLAGVDKVIYLTDEGKFILEGDQYKEISTLPTGVSYSNVKSMIFTTSQSIVGSLQDSIVILTYSEDIYYTSSAAKVFSFGTWKQVLPATSSVLLRVNRPNIVALCDLGTRIGAVGRFSKDGKSYGIIRPTLQNMDIWEIWDFSQFCTVPSYSDFSYCNGVYVSSDDETYMYGCILDDIGNNILSANITNGPYDYKKVVYPPTGYQEIVSIAETKTGRIAVALEPSGSRTDFSCGGPQDARKGLRRCLLTWNSQTKTWTPIQDVADTAGTNRVSDFKLLNSNIGTAYGDFCFILATKCAETSGNIYSVMFKIDQLGKISSFVVKKSEFKLDYPILKPLFYSTPFNGYVIIPYNVSVPSKKQTIISGEDNTDPALALKSKIADKGKWIMGGIGLVVLGIYIYSRVVSNIGKTQRQIAKIAKAYEQRLAAPPPQPTYIVAPPQVQYAPPPAPSIPSLPPPPS